MNITGELEKLAALRQAGHLSEAEFAEAKRQLLGEPSTPTSAVATKRPPPSVPAMEPTQYTSSRWSSGNLFFPDRLRLASDGMDFRKGALFSSSEEHINYRAVASFKVRNGIFLSNITIETSGGSQPIYMNGLWKSDSRKIQETIRAYQGAV